MSPAFSAVTCPTGMTADAGATSVEQCYVELEAGKDFFAYDNGDGTWIDESATCVEGYYCPGGKFTIADMDVDLVGGTYEDGQVWLGAFVCPSGMTSPEGATLISQCCTSSGTLCGGQSFRISFYYSTDKVTSVQPSIYTTDWYLIENYGVDYRMIINGSDVGFAVMFPVPKYKSDSGIKFMGWYTEPNGKGTQIAGPDGLTSDGKMPSNTLFKAATTLYAYEKTGEECRVGQYFNGTEYVSCPENYYCPGVGTTPLDTPGCRVACPAGTVSSGGYSADRIDACHAPCDVGYVWNESAYECQVDTSTHYWTFSDAAVAWLDLPELKSLGLNFRYGDAEFNFWYWIKSYDRPSVYGGGPLPIKSRVDQGLVFKGFYTAENCGGTQLVGSDGGYTVTTSSYPYDATLYPCEVNVCAAGITQIKTGSGVAVLLYAAKPSSPALAVGYAGQVCYGELAEGAQAGAINVTSGGKTYHTK